MFISPGLSALFSKRGVLKSAWLAPAGNREKSASPERNCCCDCCALKAKDGSTTPLDCWEKEFDGSKVPKSVAPNEVESNVASPN